MITEDVIKDAEEFLSKMKDEYKPRRISFRPEKPIFGEFKDVKDALGLQYIITKEGKLAFRASDIIRDGRINFSNGFLKYMYNTKQFGSGEVGYVKDGKRYINFITLSGIMRILCTKNCRGSTLFALYLFLHIAPSIHDIFPDITYIDMHSKYEHDYLYRFKKEG